MVDKNKISFAELAELCHELNTLTNRQYRPGHQLVKLFNSLSHFSRSGEYYKNEDQVLRLFATYSPDYKQTHPYVVTNLAKFILLEGAEKKEALQNFAKQLDEHEQWEWESRRKAKTRRKAHHHGKSPTHQPSKYLESPAFTPVAGMSSLSRPTSSATLSSMSSTNTLSSMSSEEPEDLTFRHYPKEFDPVWPQEDRWQKMSEHERYQSEYMREQYRRDPGREYYQHQQRYAREQEHHAASHYAQSRMPPAYKGKSFAATNRHISSQLYQGPPADMEYDSVLAPIDRWEWDDKHYSDLVNRLQYDEDRHLSPYVSNFC